MTNQEDKLQGYFELTGKAKSLSQKTLEISLKNFPSYHEKNYLRFYVIFCFAKKSYFTFEALTEDAKKRHSESMHHLKTLLECFIYYHWIVQDCEDTRAKLVLARAEK
tara:strand:- start:37 stop:360 length:324 start_codon:yes stop_codon:yes gene_type:complete